MDLTTISDFECPDGSIYNGECFIKYGMVELCGKGSIQFPNGDSYTGEFKNGNINGYGRYKFQDGDIHIGWFKDGVPNGVGNLYRKYDIYVGFFENGKSNGWGLLYGKYRNFCFGWWKNDVLIQNETSNVQWIKQLIDAQLAIYNQGLVQRLPGKSCIMFGIPQLQITSKLFNNKPFSQPSKGFLFDNNKKCVIVGEMFYREITGWLVIYNKNKTIQYGLWENGILQKEANLSAFQ